MVWKKPEPIPGFSALKFKEECQARVQAELEGLTPEEQAEKIHQMVLSGPFGQWWKNKLATQGGQVVGGTWVQKRRVYIDTSVAGGCFDDEFAEWSLALFQMARGGKIVLVLSDLFFRELEKAPQHVQAIIPTLPAEAIEVVSTDEKSDKLHVAYMTAGIVGPGSEDDAQHVANAAVAGVDVVVSWNMKHIVHYDKIVRYNQVNMFEGYRVLSIHTPKEVV